MKMLPEIKKLLTDAEEKRQIKCPYCLELQANDDNQYPVTYWGDDGHHKMECDKCESTFWVKEDVERTYRVAKTEEELIMMQLLII